MDWDNNHDIVRALILLFSLQTADEQVRHETAYQNSVGFNSADASTLTDIALQVVDGKPDRYNPGKVSRFITQSQLSLVKRMIRKYHGQIDHFGLDNISLPEDLKFLEPKKEVKSDGTLTIEGDRLIFIPQVYPTTIVKQYGFSGDKQDGKFFWRSPLSLRAYYGVLENWPSVEVSEEVEAWVEAALAPVDVRFPEWLAQTVLFDRQKEAVMFLLDGRRRKLLGYGPGSGKSACAVLAANQSAGRKLIIAPLSLLINWKREIIKWTGDTDIAIWHGSVGREAQWVITNYNTAVDYLTEHDEEIKKTSGGKPKKITTNWRSSLPYDFSTVIFDESILVKSKDAQRAKASKVIADKIPTVYLLSGGPKSRFLDDLYMQFHILDPQRTKSYKKFAETYCYTEDIPWGQFAWHVIGDQPDGYDRIKRDFADMYISATLNEVVPDLPDLIVEPSYVEMDPTQYSLYRQMEQDFVASLPEGDEILAPNVLARLTRLIQLSSNPALLRSPETPNWPNICPKLDATLELLEYTPGPHIIWITYLRTADLVAEALKKRKLSHGILTGTTNEQDRQLAVDNFQAGKLDVLVAHPGVGKFGFTLTTGRTSLYLERGYNGDDNFQSLYRTLRIGTVTAPHIVNLISVRPEGEGGKAVDEIIDQVLDYRRETNIRLTSRFVRENLGH